MSKHLKEVFASTFHVSFLETIQPEPCNVKGTMDIIIEEINDDGSPWKKQATRFVKVCHSQNECTHYEIAIDPETGIGKITLQNLAAMKYRMVQVDECGTQMMNQDLYEISYMVDDEVQEGDYAEVSFEGGREHAVLRIINRRLPDASLIIHKCLRDRRGNELPLCEDMEFLVRITRSDCFERFVKLNRDNDFCARLDHLHAGIYHIEEYEYCDYLPFYRMNDAPETTSTLFELNPGNNQLDIINEERVNTQLIVQKYVKDACGELCKPSCFEEFEVMIISDEHEECIVLCEENDFCATLYGLKPGFYDVREINCDVSLYDTTYVVNGCDESRSAALEIAEGNCDEVWIINSNIEREVCCETQESPLRICKYIRRCDGCIVKPDDNCQFKVMVCGCGMQEAFYLNANNNFCMDMASLCFGEYQIEEISCNDYTTSYSINGGREKTSACICYDGTSNFCVSIINEERNRGSIRITKYIRNEFGDMMRPDKQQCFTGTLSSYFCRRCFELNDGNDFSVCFDDLRFGSYDIREDENCDYQTSYQVNCDRERRHARITVDDCCDNEVKIINAISRSSCGILRISKFVETACRELVKPARDEEFDVRVESDCFCETYTLRASNNWSIQLEGLEAGEYRVCECDEECYDVSYLVNRELAQSAIVCMGECNQEVSIINRARQSGVLRLRAVVRTCECDIVQPSLNTSFDILVEGSDEAFCVTLCAANNWCMELDELCEGKYRIIQKDNMGYKVSYYVHGREESFGKIRLGSQDEEVTIINEETACMGNVIVTKYMMDEDGNICMPCPQDEFHFELSSRCFCRTYTLRKRNDFCIWFDDLDEGDYEICELDEGYDVSYRINGECVDRAAFTLCRDDIHVDIINMVKTSGVVHVEKRIRKGNALVRPDVCDRFQFLLKGKNCHEIYELNADNDFCIQIDNLCNQHYEIKELNASCSVCYDVNGTLQDDGYFLFDGEALSVTIINEEMLYGCMEISKMVEGDDGCLHRPGRYDCFEIMVESDCFKQKVVLNNDNDFCVRLYDLPQGHYELCELDAACCVSYLINDLPYESACVDVCEDDVCVCVINHPCALGSLNFTGIVEENGCRRDPQCGETITFSVNGENCCENIILQDTCDFSKSLCNLKPGNYKLTALGNDTLSFEMEGQCFDNDVCIELNGECVDICVVHHKERGVSITLNKCMKNTRGQMVSPDAGDCFTIIVKHDGCEETVTLHAHNDFQCVMQDMPAGSYEICETGEDNVSYQINDECLQEHGRFEVCDQDVCVNIINVRKSSATVHVEACIQDCEGRMVKPCGDACFQVDITGDDMCKTVTLNAKNAWHVSMLLKEGRYHVSQQPNACYCDHCYMLNDHKVEQAIIDICDEDQYVTVLNVECCARGSIELCKLIRDEEGCYRYPDHHKEYAIMVKGEKETRRVVLNGDNHFYACLRNLCDGTYEISEESGMEGVEYVVNNAMAQSMGIVHVSQNANTVNIINPWNMQPMNGSITLNKYVASPQGLFMKPQSGSYRIHISKPGYNELFYLNKENDYHMVVSDLKEGLYVVDEVDHEGVTYIVNGGSQVDQASVDVRGDANNVDIINPYETSEKGSITLAKYIRENGQLMRPQGTASYVFLVSRPGYNQLFTLDASNRWMMTISDLDDGDYVISETTNTDRVSYIINGSTEVDRAVVSVRGNSNTVQIINSRIAETGSLELRKYMRDAASGELVDPAADFTTRVHISSPGYNEVVTLNASNGWRYTLRSLAPALYVVDELDSSSRVTYIVDNGSEVDRAIVNVRNEAHHVDIINGTSAQGKGSIHIEKYVREGMRLRRPQGDFTATLYISKPGFQQVFTLDASNDWMVDVTNLDNGLYVLDEVSTQDQVSYIINGGTEVSNGVVSVEDNTNMVMMIDTVTKPQSSIQIAKFIRSSDGTLVSPENDASFTVEVSGDDNYLNMITLNRDNNWNVTLSNLKNGYYEVREMSNQGYSISYIVDNGLETSNASIRLLNNAHTISIINSHEATLGRLELTKLIKEADGTLIAPADGDQYVVQISNDTINRRVRLDSGNEFTAVIQDLPAGEYRVLEVEGLNYLTTYRINGGPEQVSATITMASGVNNRVEVINELRGNRNTIEVFKYMLDNDGNYLPPSAPNVYQFTITGLDNGIKETYELNVANSWHQSLRTLPSGRYQVEEAGTSPYPIKYLINSADLRDQAIFTAYPGSTQIIGIINTMYSEGEGNGSIVLTKRIRVASGNLIVPQNGEVFTVNVSGNGNNSIVTLEPANNYTFTLADMAFGVYTVEEVTSDYDVTYRVNEGIETSSGIVNVDSTATNTVLIVNTPNADTTPDTGAAPVFKESNTSVRVVLE